MKARAYVKNRQIRFGSLIAEQRFFENAEGKYLIISTDDATSAEKRRFFEGCLVPVVFYAHPHSGWRTFEDAREALKLEFLPRKKVKTLSGMSVEITISTTRLTNDQFGHLLDAVVHWLTENKLVPEEAIDPENYKRWRDAAPSPGEVYPPLARLKELYDREYGAAS